MKQRIAIIGGGAAGMMCAATLIEGYAIAGTVDYQIDIFDKNTKLGVKVAISGGGRCNVTTAVDSIEVLFGKYIRGVNLLKPALLAFPPYKVRDWFTEHGVSLKIEPDLRVFPVSDKGSDIVDLFLRIFSQPRVNIHYREAVKSISREGVFKLMTARNTYEYDIVVVATGGSAYGQTGSTGDGYQLAQSLGHKIGKLGPSLNSFETAETWPTEIKGLSLSSASIVCKLASGDKVQVSGPLIFTHFGVSGPVVFALAAHAAFERIDKSNQLGIRLIPITGKGSQAWESELIDVARISGNRHLSTMLNESLPRRFVEIVLAQLGVDHNLVVANVGKELRKKLSKVLGEGIELSLANRRSGDEFVTAGGIESCEVNRKTMESRLVPGLYFAGEILDIDGLTGGFNLQSAWSTGRLAAVNILRKCGI